MAWVIKLVLETVHSSMAMFSDAREYAQESVGIICRKHGHFGGYGMIDGIPVYNRTKRVRKVILVTVLLKRIAGAFFAFVDARDAPGAMIRAFGTLSAVCLGSGAFVGVVLAFSAPRAACHGVSSVLAVERAGRTGLTRCCPGVGFVGACLASCTRAPVGSCVACVAFAVF